ncbi:jg1702 [Pararge aegeria aegeria]|uniref:Jg1702 protein n=1 Tax=Pararge aegeria aegeria TaxID=348720 RepID=A0A8S4SHZ6_9NEOP|nr:jg1702 [Pararge aegeria aegeria]
MSVVGTSSRALSSPSRIGSRSRSAASFLTNTVSQKETTAFHALSSASIAVITAAGERSLLTWLITTTSLITNEDLLRRKI